MLGGQAQVAHLGQQEAASVGDAVITIDITVTSNDGKRVEKVLLLKSGDKYVAKRENEPSLYEIDAKNVSVDTIAAVLATAGLAKA